MFKKIIIIVVLITILILVFLQQPFLHKKDTLRATFFDVGQGDSVLIQTPQNKNIIIDGGPDNRVIEKLGTYLPFSVRTIDLLILSHPHSDHLIGFVEVLKRYRVRQVMITGVLHTSPEYLTFLEEIQKQSIKKILITSPRVFELEEGIRLEVLYPLDDFSGAKVENLNNTSIAVRLIYNHARFLSVGDIEEEGEAKLLQKNFDISADVLKTGHHGSDTSSALEFLKKVSPRWAVISVGKDNDFGHPSRRVLKRLKDLEIETLRTDEAGDILFESDGEKIWKISP